MKAPVNIVLISEGLFIGRDRNDLAQLARLAAQARVSFFVVQPDESMFDMDTPRTRQRATTSVMPRGSSSSPAHARLVLQGRHGAAGAFDRISRELSGYYLLSFEPTDADRTIARPPHQGRGLERRGLTVRARSTFALADAGPAASKTGGAAA